MNLFTHRSLSESLFQSEDIDDSFLSPAWMDILQKSNIKFENNQMIILNQQQQQQQQQQHRKLDSHTCELPNTIEKIYLSKSLEIRNILNIELSCIIYFIHKASSASSVLRVMMGTLPETLNYEIRGLIQSGSISNEPYRMSGLTGKNQIVGVVDTGLNDLSCFFVDNSNSYASILTDRSGALQQSRRKVIQYISKSDYLDYEGGHGTHVAGTIVGSSLSSHSDMNGMAPDAKITFYDVGE